MDAQQKDTVEEYGVGGLGIYGDSQSFAYKVKYATGTCCGKGAIVLPTA